MRAAYAVCTIAGVVEATYLSTATSALAAELIALTRACCVSEGIRVTIYTDSHYEFSMVHDFGQLGSQRGFMTSSAIPIQIACKVLDL